MPYEIKAIIAKSETFRKANLKLPIVILPFHMGLLPLTKENLQTLKITRLLLEDFYEIIPDRQLDSVVGAMSKYGKVALIQANLFGGNGDQACMVWDNGNRTRLEVSKQAINHAIFDIEENIWESVKKDKFESFDLGRFRSTQEWAEIAKVK